MEKIDPRTTDITQENIERLIELFPSVATETTDADGNVRQDIDLDALRELIGAGSEGQRERYQFTWPGKRVAKEEARRLIDKTLRPECERSVNWDDTQNLYIEGDNLDALKILRSTYAGKVKLIYIDPPYNTGHDFIYDDDFSHSQSEYDDQSGDYDENGFRLVANLAGNGRFHSNWCSFVYPRLLLARDLLSNDGVIFISIDQNECTNLQKMCHEVFGADNFVACIACVNKPSGRSDDKYIATAHENILVYRKSGALRLGGFEPEEHITSRYTKTLNGRLYRDEDLRKRGTNDERTNRPNLFYPFFYNESTGELLVGDNQDDTPEGYIRIVPMKTETIEGSWRWGKDTARKQIDHLHAVFMSNKGQWSVHEIQFLDERGDVKPTSVWAQKDVNSERGTESFVSLGFNSRVFQNPKPVGTLKRIVRIATHRDSYVLDFFSGSGTIAQAVFEQNIDDGGTRHFIAVQLPEPCAVDTVAYASGYSTICEIGEERIRRAGAKIVAEVEEANRQLKLGEEPKPVPDVGFRVLRIESSNFTDTYATPDAYDQDQLHLFEDNVKPGRSDLDLLFQVLPTLRIPYSAAMEEIEVCGKRAFDVNHGQLVACFDVEVGADCIEQIAKMRPIYAVFRDASMADDATEANFEELFKTFSPDTVRRVI